MYMGVEDVRETLLHYRHDGRTHMYTVRYRAGGGTYRYSTCPICGVARSEWIPTVCVVGITDTFTRESLSADSPVFLAVRARAVAKLEDIYKVCPDCALLAVEVRRP